MKSTMLKKIKSLAILTLLAAALGACATIEGAGDDIETVGDAVEDATDG